MMRPFLALLALSLGLGCKSPSQETTSKPATTAAATHAASSAKPGTHEDWCDEHQVPESLCTRCNPQLSAAFKATGD